MSTTCHEEITADIIRSRFRDIIAILRFLAARGQFSYLDRMASALDMEAVKSVLYDALRAYRAMLNSATKVRVKLDDKEETTIIALDWEGTYDSCANVESSSPYLAMLLRTFGDIVKCGRVLEKVADLEPGKCYVFFTAPLTEKGEPAYPNDKRVAELMDLIDCKGSRIVQTIVTLALSGSR